MACGGGICVAFGSRGATGTGTVNCSGERGKIGTDGSDGALSASAASGGGGGGVSLVISSSDVGTLNAQGLGGAGNSVSASGNGKWHSSATSYAGGAGTSRNMLLLGGTLYERRKCIWKLILYFLWLKL